MSNRIIEIPNSGSGSGNLEYQPEITTSTTLTTEKGLNKVYPVNSSSAVVITVPEGYAENDVINFSRKGSGSVEFVGINDNVRLRGVRDVDNRYFINDRNSWVSLICRGSNEFEVIGRLTDGYTGAVTTSNYTVLTDTSSPQDVTVTGTGFSDNMLVSLTGNGTLNSFTVTNQFECVLNITPSGSAGDSLTVEYDNGDVFIDTDSITLTQGLSYNTADIRVYYRLTSDANDYQSSAVNGSASNVTFGSSGGVFNGSSSQIDIPDNDALSFGDGTTDDDLSFSFTITPNDITNDRVIFMKRGNANAGSGGTGSIVQNEYQVDLSGGDLRVLFFSQDNAGDYLFRTYTGLSISNEYHCVITKTGSTIKLYVDKVEVSLGNSDAGVYVAMNNNTRNLFIGAKGYTPYDLVFDGNIKRVGLWKTVLNQTNIDDLYEVEITNNQDAL